MAKRPVFAPTKSGRPLVKPFVVEFEWSPGMSVKQKQRSIASLHEQAMAKYGFERILEISSKSQTDLGVKLSAFNLQLQIPGHKRLPVESVYQGSKVFEKGGPFTDLYEAAPSQAKRDHRLQESGRLLRFEFMDEVWPLDPPTMFYNCLYLYGLMENRHLAAKLLVYDGFTDIEFNPDKSLNCQAYSAALYVSLHQRGLLENVPVVREEIRRILIADDRQQLKLL